MISFELTKEQLEMQEMAHNFAKNEIRPVETELDKLANADEVFKSESFWKVLRKAYELGFHRMSIPEEMGGLGLDPIIMYLVLEELAWGGAGLASDILVAPVAAMFTAMFAGGNEELVEKYVRPFCEDKEAKHIGAWAITEPEHGSDCGFSDDPKIHFETTAKLDGDEYVINGAKSAFVSNGGIADLLLLMACVDPSQGMLGTGVFLVPGDLPGISRGKPLDKLGLRVLNQAEIFFDNVRIPQEYMLWPPGEGYQMLLETIVTFGNTSVGVLGLGVARAAYEEALSYAKERIQGGKPLIEHQAIALRLFDAYMSIEAARALLWKAAWYNTTHMPGDLRLTAAARVFATDMAMRVTVEMVQVLGGYGISKEYSLEKFLRDAKPLQIMDGTNDMMSLGASTRL